MLMGQPIWLWRSAQKTTFTTLWDSTSTPQGLSRGREEDIVTLPGLWFDLDLFGPGHQQTSLPQDEDEAAELLNEFPLQPTMIIHTGGGLHLYWLFREPWHIEDKAARECAKRLSTDFQTHLIELGQKRGYIWDKTYSLNQLLRLPGTYNHKGKSPIPVECREYHSDRRYSVEELKRVLATRVSGEQTTQILAGQRNTELTRLAGKLRREGLKKEEIEAALLAANEKRCSPPLEDSEVKTIAASVSKYNNQPSQAQIFPLTDMGNAQRLVHDHGKNLRYQPELVSVL